MREIVRQGGCLCGAIRFEVVGEPLDSGYCYCRQCQRQSGAPVVAWANFPSAGFTVRGEMPVVYATSANGRRHFCPVCGSWFLFNRPSTPHKVSLNIASLDNPASVLPRRHVHIDSRLPWFDTADDLPREAATSLSSPSLAPGKPSP